MATTPPDLDCAVALDLADQDPTINQMMASLVLQAVRRMVVGACSFMGLYLDMEQETLAPTCHPGGGGAGGELTPRGEDSVLVTSAHQRSQGRNRERRHHA